MARLIVKGGNLVWDGTGRGGHIVYVLHWLEGLRRLGHDVLYYDRVREGADPKRIFGNTMERWWDPERCAAVLPSGEAMYGMDAAAVERFARDADGIISLGNTYAIEPDPWLAGVRPRILVEQDPGYTQIWIGDGDPFAILGRHDFYFTVGANVGTPRCNLPTYGLDWRPIWNPVVLDWWNPGPPPAGARFSTVAGWWGYTYQIYEGRMWGPKAEQFRQFIALPRLVDEPLVIALEAQPDDPDIGLLQEHGWLVQSPQEVVASAEDYRAFVTASAGEFTCAKGIYVGTNSGWFSDRSACYLAAGRPVVMQATGFADVLPTGEGLFSVSAVDEAAEAIRAIRSDYQRHSRAARQLAEDIFSSDRVLPAMLRHAGVA